MNEPQPRSGLASIRRALIAANKVLTPKNRRGHRLALESSGNASAGKGGRSVFWVRKAIDRRFPVGSRPREFLNLGPFPRDRWASHFQARSIQDGHMQISLGIKPCLNMFGHNGKFQFFRIEMLSRLTLFAGNWDTILEEGTG